MTTHPPSPVGPAPLVHEHRLRVRYCETDRMGVSHHGSYIDWFEEARTEWLRVLGKTYRQMEEEGVFLQVVELRVRYLSPTTYDDELVVRTSIKELRHVAVTLQYEVHDAADGRSVALGETRLACVDGNGKLCRLPDILRRQGVAGG